MNRVFSKWNLIVIKKRLRNDHFYYGVSIKIFVTRESNLRPCLNKFDTVENIYPTLSKLNKLSV